MLSNFFVDSDWYNYETLLFIHNSHNHQGQYIIPVFIDLSEDEIRKTRLGVYNYKNFSSKENNLSQEDLLMIAKSVVGGWFLLLVFVISANLFHFMLLQGAAICSLQSSLIMHLTVHLHVTLVYLMTLSVY